MKPKILLVIMFIMMSMLLGADETTLTYATVVIESFDDPTDQIWIARGSKFNTDGYPKVTYVPTWPQALFGRNWENKDLRCMGVEGKFNRKGFNYIELIPVSQDNEGNMVSDPIKIPGRAQYLDIWVWGSNYDYYLEAHIIDYLGIDHVLPLGSLQYDGWRNLSVTIPTAIPQKDIHLPKYKNIELTKLVLWTQPVEDVNGFYVYFDHIKVLTDLYQERFDGDELIDREMVEQIWGSNATEEE